MRAKGQLSKKCLVAFLLCFLQERGARNRDDACAASL